MGEQNQPLPGWVKTITYVATVAVVCALAALMFFGVIRLIIGMLGSC